MRKLEYVCTDTAHKGRTHVLPTEVRGSLLDGVAQLVEHLAFHVEAQEVGGSSPHRRHGG